LPGNVRDYTESDTDADKKSTLSVPSSAADDDDEEGRVKTRTRAADGIARPRVSRRT